MPEFNFQIIFPLFHSLPCVNMTFSIFFWLIKTLNHLLCRRKWSYSYAFFVESSSSLGNLRWLISVDDVKSFPVSAKFAVFTSWLVFNYRVKVGSSDSNLTVSRSSLVHIFHILANIISLLADFVNIVMSRCWIDGNLSWASCFSSL